MDDQLEKDKKRRFEIDRDEIMEFIRSKEFAPQFTMTKIHTVCGYLERAESSGSFLLPASTYHVYMNALHRFVECVICDYLVVNDANKKLAKMLDQAASNIREIHGVPSIQERLQITKKGEEL